MNGKKILIFEDDWSTIGGSFDLANLYAFEGKLSFKAVPKSQDVSFSTLRENYDAIFVDITLAKNTYMDGYNIVKDIKSKDLFDINKVIILTGNYKVKDKLLEMGLGKIKVLSKPFAFDDLAIKLKEVLD